MNTKKVFGYGTRNLIRAIAVVCTLAFVVLSLTGCEGPMGPQGQSVRGTTPHIGDNGNWWIGNTDTGVSATSANGQHGTTPHIGDNGNWWIGDTDTGVSAQPADSQTALVITGPDADEYCKDQGLDIDGFEVRLKYAYEGVVYLSDPIADYALYWNGGRIAKTDLTAKTYNAFSAALGEKIVMVFALGRLAEFTVTVEDHVINPTSWTATKAATCEEAGEETGTCTRCGKAGLNPRPVAPLGHIWNWTQTTAATATTNGAEAGTCTRVSSHTDTRTLWATGTAGLVFELISGGENDGTYRVRKGTVAASTAVHIPAYHRPDANSPYALVTEIGASGDAWNSGAFQFSSGGVSAVTFAAESELKSIGQNAFVNNPFTSITLPASLTTIGGSAFMGVGLAGIAIPANVTTIGDSAFSGSNFASITVDSANTAYASDNDILYNKAKTTLILVPRAKTGAVAIPNGVTTIGQSAFVSCAAITSVTIPASVTTIGTTAFSLCTGITSITIPATVTTVANNVFANWTASQTITVPFANANAKPAGWNASWNAGNNNATIVYQ